MIRVHPVLLAVPFMLGAAVAHAGPSNVDVATLTRLLTTETADLTAARVVGAAEMRDALNLEAEKEAAGCLDNSCIAEIAAAMGTSHVLQTQLGAVGSTLILSIQVFDDNARVLSRAVIRGEGIDDVSKQLRETLDKVLIAAGLRTHPGAKDLGKGRSLLVLDVRGTVKNAEVKPAPEATAGLPLLFWGGATTLGLGAVSGVAAVVFGSVFAIRNGDLKGATQIEVLIWEAAAFTAAGLATVGVLGGAAILGADWLTGDAHAE